MKKSQFFWILLTLSMAFGPLAHAQTTLTLSQDQVTIEGDLAVGTSTNKSSVVINGETGTGASPSLSIYGDGIVQFWEASPGGAAGPLTPGSRFFWDPNKAIFRVGYLSPEYSGYSAASPIGQNSAAFGNSIASGDGSFAAAEGFAYGPNSIAISAYTASAATGAVAFSYGYAGGAYSFSLDGVADAEFAIALGGNALGWASIAIGYGAVAYSARSIVVGLNNSSDDTQSPTEWRDQDELFVIGNGTGIPSDPPEVRSRNALVVRKSGDITIPKRQGDVLMGEFGNPE